MTSSGASLTESARKRMSGCVASTSEMTRAPPPPGMCTSTRTTSGTRARSTSIAHEHRNPLGLDFEIDGDTRGTRMANRVDDRLSRREQERLHPGRRAIAHAHDLDWNAVLGFDVGCDLFECDAERARRVVGPFAFEQPAAQLALL